MLRVEPLEPRAEQLPHEDDEPVVRAVTVNRRFRRTRRRRAVRSRVVGRRDVVCGPDLFGAYGGMTPV